MRIVAIIITAALIVAGLVYIFTPYKGCEKISVGSNFNAGYDCGTTRTYIPN